jgi:hypothetical protein
MKLKAKPPIAASTSTPLWLQPEAPWGSATRYLASLSPRFSRVAIEVRSGKKFSLGQSDQAVPSRLVVSIRDSSGKILGKIKVEGHTRDAFSDADKKTVERVASEIAEVLGASSWSA